MDNKISLYKPFVAELNRIKEKYGEKILELSGISSKQMDLSYFMDSLIDASTTADISIDPTSNIGSKDIDTILNETRKPQLKVKSLSRLYKDMVKEYGLNQKQAAKKLCISPAAVSQYLSGKRGILHTISPELMYEFKISAGRIIDNGDKVILAETCRLCKLIISKEYFLRQSEK